MSEQWAGNKINRVDTGSITRWASYEAATNQSLRLKQCYPGETNEEIAIRLWWAFLAVQCVELSGVYTHRDRHHFWTSVMRLVLKSAHREKPSSRYVEHLRTNLNALLSAPAAHWCGKVEL